LIKSSWQVRSYDPCGSGFYFVLFEGTKEDCKVFLLDPNEEHGLSLYDPDISIVKAAQG